MLAFQRNPDKLEQKAVMYEGRGKTAKAQKYREKAMKLRQHQTSTATTTTTSSGGLMSHMPWAQRTPARYEQNALKWEQRNNWTKAQKNREKVWRLNNPQYATATPAPMFYQNNRFLGYNVPITGTTTAGQPLSGGAARGGLFHRTPEKFEQKAAMYDQKGKTAKAQKCREKAMKLRQHQASGATGMAYPARTPGRYEQNALKWEQRGNYTKAQKNREKIWRLNNPQYVNAAAPMFYDNNRQFVGYNNVVIAPVASHMTLNKTPVVGTGAPMMAPATTMGTATTTYAAPIVEQVVRPTIVDQTMRPERIVEVQPVIHREIDAPQVRVVEKHLYETVPSAGPSTITNAPIIQETVKPRIIEEVQPVVHREVPAPFVEKVEQHVTEHIVKPTVTTKEVQGQAAGGLPRHM